MFRLTELCSKKQTSMQANHSEKRKEQSVERANGNQPEHHCEKGNLRVLYNIGCRYFRGTGSIARVISERLSERYIEHFVNLVLFRTSIEEKM
jgi:hypothetical protein